MHFDFIKILFPHLCVGCGSPLGTLNSFVCAACYFTWPFTQFEQLENNPIERMFIGRGEPAAAAACCYFAQNSAVQVLLHLLKYKNIPQAGVFMGEWMGAKLKASNRFDHIDLICPVPLNQQKRRKRGYNQTEEMAKGIVQSWSHPKICLHLIKKTFTESQTQKTRSERWENMKDGFFVLEPEQIKNKHILLIDDVITTGATLEACLQALSKAKPASISIAGFAWASNI